MQKAQRSAGEQLELSPCLELRPDSREGISRGGSDGTDEPAAREGKQAKARPPSSQSYLGCPQNVPPNLRWVFLLHLI